MKTTIRDVIVRLAVSAQGIPYIWAGATPAEGLDCSGFVVWLLRVAGVLRTGDWTAQGLTNIWGPPFTHSLDRARPGDLIVYGKDNLSITHIMMILDAESVIGSSGGGPRTLTRANAEQIGAGVHTRPLDYRKDRVGFLTIRYPDES